jgi:hypothetical protein
MDIEEWSWALSLAWTESTWRYNPKHISKYDKGLGGFRKTYWNKFLESKGLEFNSLAAISEVFKECLVIKNGNEYEAVKYYKGAKRNLFGVNKTFEVKKIIDEHILKYKDNEWKRYQSIKN